MHDVARGLVLEISNWQSPLRTISRLCAPKPQIVVPSQRFVVDCPRIRVDWGALGDPPLPPGLPEKNPTSRDTKQG
jgi:hypothetical protein